MKLVRYNKKYIVMQYIFAILITKMQSSLEPIWLHYIYNIF